MARAERAARVPRHIWMAQNFWGAAKEAGVDVTEEMLDGHVPPPTEVQLQEWFKQAAPEKAGPNVSYKTRVKARIASTDASKSLDEDERIYRLGCLDLMLSNRPSTRGGGLKMYALITGVSSKGRTEKSRDDILKELNAAATADVPVDSNEAEE